MFFDYSNNTGLAFINLKQQTVAQYHSNKEVIPHARTYEYFTRKQI